MADLDRAVLKGRVIALVNPAGGGCGPEAAEGLARLLAATGQPRAEVISLEAHAIEPALIDAAGRADMLIVLGGDGTLRTAAIACGRANIPLLPLPGGTMNLLTRALYGPLPWARALTDTLAAPTIRDVSAAEANGQRFFCAGVFGAPSLWADAREALRHWNLTGAAARAVTAIRRHGESLDYRFGGEPRGAAEAVVVICPLGALRAPHCDGALEAAAIGPSSAGVVLSLAFHAVFDDWRQDESISISKVSEVQISGHGRVPAILDGETMIMGREVVVSIVPRAFRAMTPATPLP